jgi:hypothetical protein
VCANVVVAQLVNLKPMWGQLCRYAKHHMHVLISHVGGDDVKYIQHPDCVEYMHKQQ